MNLKILIFKHFPRTLVSFFKICVCFSFVSRLLSIGYCCKCPNGGFVDRSCRSKIFWHCSLEISLAFLHWVLIKHNQTVTL